ncbi:MAG: hypothetical protein H6606_05615 [Flavobacteriales bacterium]|nr:hypothetical protein [Flavobacteriales bacterium]
MTTIDSNPVNIERTIEKVYAFLNDLRNYKNLIPTDLGEIEASEGEASMNLKGLGAFALKRVESIPNRFIKLQPEGKLPFSFHIEWELNEAGPSTRVQGRIMANMNPFIRMMAEPRLRKFVEDQSHLLKEYLEREIGS